MQLLLKSGPKRDHLGAQEKGPSVQSLESAAFRGLVVKGERARKEGGNQRWGDLRGQENTALGEPLLRPERNPLDLVMKLH